MKFINMLNEHSLNESLEILLNSKTEKKPTTGYKLSFYFHARELKNNLKNATTTEQMENIIKEQAIDKENALPIKYNKNYYVIQANELVRSRQDELTLLEAKLIRLAIAQVLKDDDDLKTYTCNISLLADFLGISSQNIYRDVQD